jgi:hypothetical protein
MGFAEFGARGGFPVVNAHGGLACRRDVAAADPVASECGIRLISQRAPFPAQQWFRMMRFAAHVAPSLYGRLAARELGPVDGAVIRGEGSTPSP